MEKLHQVVFPKVLAPPSVECELLLLSADGHFSKLFIWKKKKSNRRVARRVQQIP